MPKYKSFFASPESVREKWNLPANEAKKVYELWDMAYDALQNTKLLNIKLQTAKSQTDKDKILKLIDENLIKLINEQEGYFKQKPGVFDNPDGVTKRVEVGITSDQWTRFVCTYGVQTLMRMLSMPGQDNQQKFHTVWSGVKGKEGGDVDAAKQTARKFNEPYGRDEFLNYVQYLASTTKNVLALKPYVVPDGRGGFNLYVWHKK